jgi:hypothetical protein
MSRLNFGHMGNGITVWIKGTNDMVAHIQINRNVKFYDDPHRMSKPLTTKEKQYIDAYAQSANPTISATQSTPVFKNYTVSKYVITGKDKSGKRFIIHTTTPQHYNIWEGTLWKIVDGKRKKVKNYYN